MRLPGVSRLGFSGLGVPRLSTLAVAACGLALSVTTAAAQCMIYEDRGYRGDTLTIEANRTVADLGRDWSDRVSAVRVQNGCQLVTYDETGYDGDKRTFRSDSRFVENYWDNKISSVSCVCDDASQRPEVANACMVFGDTGMRGASVQIGQNRQRSTLGILRNDVSSVSVPDGCSMRVYSEERFGGDTRDFAQGTRDRLEVGWDNTIASARCYCDADDRSNERGDRGNRGGDREEAAGTSCTLHARSEFRGQRMAFRDGDERSVARTPLGGTGQSLSLDDGCSMTFEDDRGRTLRIARSQGSLPQSVQDYAVRATCGCEDRFGSRRSTPRVARSQAPAPLARTDGADDRPMARTDDLADEPTFGGRGDALQSDENRSSIRGRAIPDEADAFGDRRDDAPRDDGGRDVASRSNDFCEIYEDGGYRGERLRLEANTGLVTVGSVLDNAVSSVRVSENCTLTLFENRQYGGRDQSFRRDTSELGLGMNDLASSATCRCEAREARAATSGTVRSDTRSQDRDDRGSGDVFSRRDDDTEFGASDRGGDTGFGRALRDDRDDRASRPRDDDRYRARGFTRDRDADATLGRGGDRRVAGTGRGGNAEVATCTLYADDNLAGDRLVIEANMGMSWVGRQFADSASSAMVSDGCALSLYRDRNYAGGEPRRLERGLHRSLDPEWDNATRSVKCFCRTAPGESRDAG